MLKTEPRMTLTSVKFVNDLNIFGALGGQISATMSHITIRWDGDKVVVRSVNHPDKEEWVMLPAIAKLTWTMVG